MVLRTGQYNMNDLRRRRSAKKGFQFNMIVVGTSGLGKSTFINTLCDRQVLQPRDFSDPSKCSVEKTVEISPLYVEMDEDGVKLSLTIVDTPGFGDNIDNTDSFDQILGYIEKQYDDILAEESRIKRNPSKFQDNRVCVLLYFISPTGHGLREIDIELMRKLSPRVNVIPCVAKADTLTATELAAFKKRIMEDIEHYKIPIYNFPYDVEEDDDETIEENKELRALLPFAIVGSTEEIQVAGRRVRGRQYPWGVVEVDNLNHCDFTRLRYVLLSSHLQDLKEITHDVLYEAYRTEKLSKLEGLTERFSNLTADEAAAAVHRQSALLPTSQFALRASHANVNAPNGTQGAVNGESKKK